MRRIQHAADVDNSNVIYGLFC
eukprot:COSAG02_NODE_47880_length_338_cov_0.598326_1_plen_21_part_01